MPRPARPLRLRRHYPRRRHLRRHVHAQPARRPHGHLLLHRHPRHRRRPHIRRLHRRNPRLALDLEEMLHNSSVKAIHILATKPALLGFGLWFSLAWFLTSSSSPSSPSPSRKKRLERGRCRSVVPYIALCRGTTFGFALNFPQISKYRFIVTDSAREPTPEARLYGALLGSIWQPIGLFYLQLHVVQGATLDFAGDCLGPQYRGHFLYLESCYSFTSDCYRENSSSAIAGQGFMRNTLGALSPLFASQFFSIIWAVGIRGCWRLWRRC